MSGMNGPSNGGCDLWMPGPAEPCDPTRCRRPWRCLKRNLRLRASAAVCPPRRLGCWFDQLPRDVPDPRDQRGRTHSGRAVLAIIVLAKLCGVAMGQRQIAEFARGLTQPQRRALGCRRNSEDRAHFEVPAESTYQRALVHLDFTRLQPVLLRWQNELLGPQADPLIAIDGKHLRRSGGLASASASGQPSQRVHAPVSMAKHDSELIAVRTLLAQTEFTDRMLGMDSLHTQHETLHQVLYDHGADYLVPLKENQKPLLATARTLLPEDFSPGRRRLTIPSTRPAVCAKNSAAERSSAGSSRGP